MTDPLDLVISRIDNLHADVRNGFSKINGRLGKTEDRVGECEKWQASTDGEGKASTRFWGAVGATCGLLVGAGIEAVSEYFIFRHGG